MTVADCQDNCRLPRALHGSCRPLQAWLFLSVKLEYQSVTTLIVGSWPWFTFQAKAMVRTTILDQCGLIKIVLFSQQFSYCQSKRLYGNVAKWQHISGLIKLFIPRAPGVKCTQKSCLRLLLEWLLIRRRFFVLRSWSCYFSLLRQNQI